MTQPLGTFYIGALDSTDLVDISWAAIQTIKQGEIRGEEQLLGIERPLSVDRVREIEKYVNSVDATFPTSVILAVSSEHAEYDNSSQMMTLPRAPNVAEILDGQHRIEGLKAFSNGVFQVNVTIFLDMDIEDRAMVFAIINLKQTRVSTSMAYNMYAYATSRSPQKTCHDIAKLLNSKEGSPFEDKIKILGIATKGKQQETLTQAAFVERLMQLISDDPDTDRDWLKRGRSLQKVDEIVSRRLVFRNTFIDEQDAEIARVVWNYFSAVRRKWPRAWNVKERGRILNRTTGFAALMNVLPMAYMSIAAPGEIVSEDNFYGVFDKATLQDDDFTPDNFKPGSAGQAELTRRLREAVGP